MCYINDLYRAIDSSAIANFGASALLDHLARLTRAHAQTALEAHGLRPRLLVALTLLRDHGGVSQQALAAALQIDKTNLVGLLNELERGGLIARRRSSEDRRRHIVEITAAGAAKLGEAEAALASIEDEVLGGLSASERETLYHLLQRATTEHVLDCTRATQDWAGNG